MIMTDSKTQKRLSDVPPETEFYVKNENRYGCTYLGGDGQKMCHIFDGGEGKEIALTPENDKKFDIDVLPKKERSFRYATWTLERNGYEELDEYHYKKTLEDGTEFSANFTGCYIDNRCHLMCSDSLNELEKTDVSVDNLKEAENVLLKAIRFLREEREYER